MEFSLESYLQSNHRLELRINGFEHKVSTFCEEEKFSVTSRNEYVHMNMYRAWSRTHEWTNAPPGLCDPVLAKPQHSVTSVIRWRRVSGHKYSNTNENKIIDMKIGLDENTRHHQSSIPRQKQLSWIPIWIQLAEFSRCFVCLRQSIELSLYGSLASDLEFGGSSLWPGVAVFPEVLGLSVVWGTAWVASPQSVCLGSPLPTNPSSLVWRIAKLQKAWRNALVNQPRWITAFIKHFGGSIQHFICEYKSEPPVFHIPVL